EPLLELHRERAPRNMRFAQLCEAAFGAHVARRVDDVARVLAQLEADLRDARGRVEACDVRAALERDAVRERENRFAHWRTARAVHGDECARLQRELLAPLNAQVVA